MADEVRRNDAEQRYEIVVDGMVAGIADFRLDGETVVLPHTEIDASRRGQGLGAILVQGALDDIRDSGRTVVPVCWYVAKYIEEHPQEQDLLAA
ncbi:MAG: N-acetyltransferase [Acidimicrobiales bacterium]|nr:N-acetyltransferase [Acidimicrobiales bacterium]